MPAVATFAAVRSANRAARAAERSLLAGLRPLMVPSRLEDGQQKVFFSDGWHEMLPGGGAIAADHDGVVYLAASLRNAGNGIGVLHGWMFYPGDYRGNEHPDPATFRRQTRDLYIAPGDIGFWQARVPRSGRAGPRGRPEGDRGRGPADRRPALRGLRGRPADGQPVPAAPGPRGSLAADGHPPLDRGPARSAVAPLADRARAGDHGIQAGSGEPREARCSTRSGSSGSRILVSDMYIVIPTPRSARGGRRARRPARGPAARARRAAGVDLLRPADRGRRAGLAGGPARGGGRAAGQPGEPRAPPPRLPRLGAGPPGVRRRPGRQPGAVGRRRAVRPGGDAGARGRRPGRGDGRGRREARAAAFRRSRGWWTACWSRCATGELAAAPDGETVASARVGWL